TSTRRLRGAQIRKCAPPSGSASAPIGSRLDWFMSPSTRSGIGPQTTGPARKLRKRFLPLLQQTVCQKPGPSGPGGVASLSVGPARLPPSRIGPLSLDGLHSTSAPEVLPAAPPLPGDRHVHPLARPCLGPRAGACLRPVARLPRRHHPVAGARPCSEAGAHVL